MKLIEFLANNAIDEAWLKGFDKGFDEGISVLKEFAKRLKEKASYRVNGNCGLSENGIDQTLDEILKEYEEWI